MSAHQTAPPSLKASEGMRREINWLDAFWIVSGITTLILTSIGAIAATIGPPSWLIWAISTTVAFIQLFIYAEMAGMFPNHSGGAAVYGAIAWRRYGKIFAPINIWCNWLGWSPVLAIGSSIAASYIISVFFADTAFANFSFTLLDLSAVLPGISINISGPIITAAVILLVCFYIQHNGVLRMARIQFLLAVLSLGPILLLSIVPLLTGKVNWQNFLPFLVEGTTSWFSQPAFTLLMGGLFISAWTTYAGEAAMCYVSEYRNPDKDTIRAVATSGLLAFVAYTLLPFVFLGVLGMSVLKDPAMVAGDAQTAIVKMAELTFGNGFGKWIAILLVMALMLMVITAMAGSSRTLYQSSVEGWLPKYLGHLNQHGAPTKAMWTDLAFNLFLLSLGSPLFVLAASCVAFLLGVCMNLNAAWMHRKDRPDHVRPYRAPDWLIFVGAPLLSLLNLAFIIFGSNVFAPNALLYGLVAITIVLPIFYYRHYIVDKGVWPEAAQKDLGLEEPLS